MGRIPPPRHAPVPRSPNTGVGQNRQPSRRVVHQVLGNSLLFMFVYLSPFFAGYPRFQWETSTPKSSTIPRRS